MVQVTIFPGSAGIATNTADLTATGANPATASVTTGVGGLRISKRTTTPAVNSGTTATYVLEVENTSPASASDVVVTDTLPSGFTYSSTGSISGGTRTSTSDPTVGDQVPAWGTFSIASGDTLTITFNAAVAAGVAGTFDNELSATSSDTSVGIFDPLLTTAEDVTVSLPIPLVPEMDLKQGVTAIADGGSYNFGSRTVGSNTDVVFTIENTGTADLTLTTPITISGANADQFTIEAQPGSTVAGSASTTYTVCFTPTSTG